MESTFFRQPYDNNYNYNDNYTNYGLRSNISPPQNPDLISFENDIYDMVRNIAFRKVCNELGLVSKKHLAKFIANVANTTKVNQWRNTTTVIDWFKSLPQKGKSRFIKFDIVEFYPSILEELTNGSISFARSTTTISDSVINFIHHSTKSLLFDKTFTCVKKENNFLFDVTMGSYDGAEICELVRLYLLNRLSTVIDKSSVSLYRDDGLAAINNTNGPKLDRIKKDIIALFKEEGLSVTIETNLIETDFLDVTFNLATKKYFPFRKANNTPLYINAFSNHSPTIIKQLPKMINKRISDSSCNKEEFDKVKSVYESALKNSGHFSSTSYNGNTQNARRNRNRKVIWFNSPYSQNLKTNNGKLFIKLARKHFPMNDKYHKIFDLNTLKLSYCWSTNVGNIIKQHNSKVLSKTNDNNNRKCNCRSKPNCALSGECLTQCLVYKATPTTSSNSFVYHGTSEREFKTRYSNHTKSFTHRKCMNETELSKHMWNLKDHGLNNDLSWEIHKKASPYQCGSKQSDLSFPPFVLIQTLY